MFAVKQNAVTEARAFKTLFKYFSNGCILMHLHLNKIRKVFFLFLFLLQDCQSVLSINHLAVPRIIGMALVRCPVLARQRYGDLVDRVTVVRGRNGQHIDPWIPGSGGRADLRFRPSAVLRHWMAVRLLHAGLSRRDDTVVYRCADDLHTGIALLPHDGGQTRRSG